jgi:glycosyltransferase involved in cell wall biosynthesis
MSPPESKGSVWLSANTTWFVYNFRKGLIRSLFELGYEVVVLSPRDKYVQLIEALGARHVHLQLDNLSTNPMREVGALLRMLASLRRARPMALLTYTPKINIYGSMAARTLGIPVISNLSGLGYAFVAGGWLEFVAKRLYGVALRFPRTVFFENEEDRKEFVKAGLVDPRKTKRLPGAGVDLVRFQPLPRGRDAGRFVFLLVARLLWDKGVGQFVEAARKVKERFPQAEFRLLGFLDVQNPSAVSRAQIEQWEAEGIVRYLGATDDVKSQYAEADCVVLPSYYREGVPTTLLEAASMCIPIITTESTGCRDTVEDGVTGLLVKPRDPVDLANKMEKMLCLAPEDRRIMGQRGRSKMCREFDERIVIDTYLKAIQEIEKRLHGARE